MKEPAPSLIGKPTWLRAIVALAPLVVAMPSAFGHGGGHGAPDPIPTFTNVTVHDPSVVRVGRRVLRLRITSRVRAHCGLAALDAGHDGHDRRPGQCAGARPADAVPRGPGLGGQRHVLGARRHPPRRRPVPLLLLHRPPGCAHRRAGHGGLRLDHRAVHARPADAALRDVRPAQPRRHQLRPDAASQHRRSRTCSSTSAGSCGWSTAPTRAASSSWSSIATTGFPLPGQGYGKKLIGGNHSRIEGRLHPLQPRVGLLLPVPVVRRPRLQRRLQHPPRPLTRIRTVPTSTPRATTSTNVAGAPGTIFDDVSIAPFGVKLMGNWQFLPVPGEPAVTTTGYRSPGHNSAYYDRKHAPALPRLPHPVRRDAARSTRSVCISST